MLATQKLDGITGRGTCPFERLEREIDLLVPGLPVRNGNANGAAAVPRRPAHPDFTRFLHRVQHAVRPFIGFEAEENLVEDDIVQHLDALELADSLSKAPGAITGPLDELGEPAPPE